MDILNDQQRQRALQALRQYLEAPKQSRDLAPDELDKKRVQLINSELAPLISAFLNRSVGISKFKSKIDGINKRNNWWGFKGIKGQMFFNLVVNVSDGDSDCEAELRTAIAVPADNNVAASRIKTFGSYISRLRQMRDRFSHRSRCSHVLQASRFSFRISSQGQALRFGRCTTPTP